MRWSLNTGKIAGVRIQIHWTFIVLILWVILSGISRGETKHSVFISVAFLLSVFACVVLHEMGHILTARKFGIDTKKITLLPIGGVASLEKIPENPRQELLVSLAGPAVNAIIALVLYPFVPENIMFKQQDLYNISGTEIFLASLFSVNVIIMFFNLIPAFPMDGGRALRALLSMRMDRTSATRIASNIGQAIAIFFIFAGLFFNPFLSLIGVFVFFGAFAENLTVQQLEFLKGHTVREAMMTHFTILSPVNTTGEGIDQLLAGNENTFIIAEGGEVKGIVNSSRLIDALRKYGTEAPVAQIMKTDFKSIDVRTSLTEVFAETGKNGNSFFPVMDNGKLVGVINRENINEFVMVQSALNY
jgi:Zn-dependent protease